MLQRILKNSPADIVDQILKIYILNNINKSNNTNIKQ